MKLPSILQSFYRKSLRIPLVGSTIIGPFLAFCWDTTSACVDWFSKPRNQGPVLSTYSSAIAALRLQVQALESRNEALAEELNNLRWQIELRGAMEAAALDGVLRSLASNAPAMPSAESTRGAKL